MTRIGDKFKLEVDKDGKVNIQRDEAKALAKLNVSQRITARKKPKTRFAKPGENKELRKA